MSNVPKLRFKEFSDRVKLTKLNDVVELISGQHLTPEEYQNTENDAPYFTGPSDYTNDLQFVTKWALKKSKVALKDDVLITVKGSGVGELFYLSLNNVVIGRQLMAIRAKEASSKIIYQLLSLRKNTFQALASGNMIPGLSRQDILSQKLNLPSYKEQEKIASFLTTIDIKIEQLTCKEQLLQQYKKSIMQKIFNQEIRFKDDDGSEFCDWEEKKLVDIFIGKKGKGLSKGDIIDTGQNKCILYGELYTKYQEIIRDVISYTNSNDGIKSISGDLLIPCSTTTTGIDLANATALFEDNVLLGGDISILRFKKEGNSSFFAYYLTHHKKNDLAKFGQGSTIIHMYFEHFKTMKVKVPKSVEEQTKIANFLSSIDSKIEQVQKQLSSTKEFKKALLQEMFI